MSSNSPGLPTEARDPRSGAIRSEAPCIIMEGEMIRIMLSVLVCIATAALAIHFWIGAAGGNGVSMIGLAGTASAFLGFVSLVLRPWLWVRVILFAGALLTGSLFVDQAAYLVWHDRFESFVGGLQYDVERGAPDLAERMKLRPASVRIEPGQALLFTFEPPLLAWTWHVDAASPEGHRVVSRWHRFLARAARGASVDSIAANIIAPHQAYSVSVATSEDVLACRDRHDRQWMVSV